MQSRYPKLYGALCLLICAMLWGSTFVAQIFGASHIGPNSYNGLRFLIGACALIPLLLSKRKKGKIQQKSIKHTLIGALICGAVLCAGSYFQQRGMADTTAGKAGFISALYIILVPFIRILWGKRVRIIAWIGVAIALIGMYLLCIKPGGSLALGTGDLMVLISAMFYSLHIISIDHFVEETDPVLLSCLQFFVTGLIASGLALATETTTVADIMACKWAILYAGVLSCGVAYTLQAVGQRTADPLQATLLMSMESVFSAVSGALVLGERFTGREMIGCVLIMAAVLMGQCEDAVRGFIQTTFSAKKA